MYGTHYPELSLHKPLNTFTLRAKPVEAPSMAATTTSSLPEETTELSAKYETPMGLAHGTMQALKDRIKQHYDLASDYYLSLW